MTEPPNVLRTQPIRGGAGRNSRRRWRHEFQRLSAAWVTKGSEIRAALGQLPAAGAIGADRCGADVTADSAGLSNIFGWWISHVADISATKPRISRLLGYIEAAPSINGDIGGGRYRAVGAGD